MLSRLFSKSSKSLLPLFILLVAFGSETALALGASPVRVGAAAVELQLQPGNSLAGYIERWLLWGTRNDIAHWFKPSVGQSDPIRTKALLVNNGERTIAFVSIDLVGIFPQMKIDILSKIQSTGIKADDLLLVASHTHSGPGGFTNFKFWELVATDQFNKKTYDMIVDDTAKAILAAHEAMVPARVGIIQKNIAGVTVNRRGGKLNAPILTLLKAETITGRTIGSLVNFPVHGTLQGSDNMKLSSDVPGAIEREYEKRMGGVALFMSDAAGDINPVAPSNDKAGLEFVANRFMDQVQDTATTMRMVSKVSLMTKSSQVALDVPSVDLRNCFSVFNGPKENKEELLDIPISKEFARPLLLTGISMGSHLFIAVSGEPITEIGNEAKQMAFDAGFTSASIIGLANSYQGYILTAKEFKRGGYESCNSFYGPNYGQRFLDGVKEMTKTLRYKKLQ